MFTDLSKPNQVKQLSKGRIGEKEKEVVKILLVTASCFQSVNVVVSKSSDYSSEYHFHASRQFLIPLAASLDTYPSRSIGFYLTTVKVSGKAFFFPLPQTKPEFKYHLYENMHIIFHHSSLNTKKKYWLFLEKIIFYLMQWIVNITSEPNIWNLIEWNEEKSVIC